MDYIKFAAKFRVMDTEKVEDPSVEVIKLLWMLINKYASDLNEGITFPSVLLRTLFNT